MELMEQERVKLRRDYELVLSEMASVLYVDDETISLDSLKHKVSVNFISMICFFAAVTVAVVVINVLITMMSCYNYKKLIRR